MNLMTSLTGWFESLDKILFFSILGILHDDEATESGPLPDATVPAVSGDIHHVTLFCSNARKCFRWGFKMKEGCFQGCECKTEELCVFLDVPTITLAGLVRSSNFASSFFFSTSFFFSSSFFSSSCFFFSSSFASERFGWLRTTEV